MLISAQDLIIVFYSVQFSCSVVSNSLQPHGPTPGLPVHHQLPELTQTYVHWASSSVGPSPSHLQSFSASGSFQISQLFASGGQSIGVSASTSVLPMNTQDSSPLGWTGWISLQFKGLTTVFSSKASILCCSAFFIVQLSHPYMTTGKTIALTNGPLLAK